MGSMEMWRGTLHELDRATWSLAAIVASLRGDEPTARAVVDLLGPPQSLSGEEAEQVAATAVAPLLQATRFVTGGSAWNDQDDEALLAQGRASAGFATVLPEHVLPQLPESDRLLNGPIKFLDVGVGVGAMAVALCKHMPQLSVVGLDVLDRPLELARLHVEKAGLGERIELRRLDVAELDAADEFDLAWLPAPFIPRSALERGVARVAGALRPDGWVLLAHGRLGDDLMDAAITRFKTVAYGGTPVDDGEAEAMLAGVGLVDVRHLVTPPGTPAFAVGRRSPQP